MVFRMVPADVSWFVYPPHLVTIYCHIHLWCQTWNQLIVDFKSDIKLIFYLSSALFDPCFETEIKLMLDSKSSIKYFSFHLWCQTWTQVDCWCPIKHQTDFRLFISDCWCAIKHQFDWMNTKYKAIFLNYLWQLWFYAIYTVFFSLNINCYIQRSYFFWIKSWSSINLKEKKCGRIDRGFLWTVDVDFSFRDERKIKNQVDAWFDINNQRWKVRNQIDVCFETKINLIPGLTSEMKGKYLMPDFESAFNW